MEQKRVELKTKEALHVSKLSTQANMLQEQLKGTLLKLIGEYNKANPGVLDGYSFLGFDDESGELVFQAMPAIEVPAEAVVTELPEGAEEA